MKVHGAESGGLKHLEHFVCDAKQIQMASLRAQHPCVCWLCKASAHKPHCASTQCALSIFDSCRGACLESRVSARVFWEQGLSLRVPAGTSCAIVGTSGSGKSTLMRLLFRMFDSTGGSITINGTDIKQASP